MSCRKEEVLRSLARNQEQSNDEVMELVKGKATMAGSRVADIAGIVLVGFSLITGNFSTALAVASLIFVAAFWRILTFMRMMRPAVKKSGWAYPVFLGVLALGFALWFAARAQGWLV